MFSYPLSAEKFAAYRVQQEERKKVAIKDYQFYLDQISDLQDRLLKLHNTVLDYPAPVVVSNMVAMNALSSALTSYDTLKKNLAQVIPANELEEIEQSVIKSALSDDSFKNLLFIPEFQAEYEQKYNKQVSEKDAKVFSLNYNRAKIIENWAKRDEKYDTIGPGLFCASIFVIGIPYFVGKQIAGILDEIFTLIRVKIKDIQIASAKKECMDNINKVRSEFENKANDKNNQKSYLKQRFFETTLLRHSKKIEEADQRINPRLASKRSA